MTHDFEPFDDFPASSADDAPPNANHADPAAGSDFELMTFDTQTLDVVSRETAPSAAVPRARPRPAPEGPPASPARPAAQIATQPAARSVASSPARSRSRARASTARPRRAGPAIWLSTIRTMLIMLLAAMLISTIFSLWTSPSFFTDEFRAGLNRVQSTQQMINIQPTPLPTDVREVRIGIVIGHSGQPQDLSFTVDPGAVCPDGLTELEINTAVAQRVVAKLSGAGYTVDLLDEFDLRLENYLAEVLVSIHTNDCQDYGEAGTGYSVASASARQTTRGADEFLRDCLASQYGQTTGLPQHGEVTFDMSGYHTFGEVSADTPTAIIELGFMFRDRAILTGSPDVIAQGVFNGLQCFLGADTFNRF